MRESEVLAVDEILRPHPSREEENEVPVAVLGHQEVVVEAAKPRRQIECNGILRAGAQP